MSQASDPSDALFRLLAENCPGLIFIKADGKIVFINSRCSEILGYSREEIQTPGFDFQRFFPADAALELEKETVDLPVQFIRRDGEKRSGILSVQRVVWQGQAAVLGIINDVSCLQSVQQRLDRSNQRYWSLFEAAADAIFLETFDGVILDCNSAACRNYGFSREELLGMTARELVPGDYAHSLKAVAEELCRNDVVGKTLHIVSTAKHKDGRIFPTEVSITPLEINGENLYLVVVRDISHRRELETARRRYDHQMQQIRLLENFSNVVNGLANDFNNLLTGIMGYADLIQRELSPSSPSREKVRKILDASRKGGEFIQQLISSTGRLPANFQTSDLVAVVRELVPELSSIVAPRGFLTCVFSDALPELNFDAGQIKAAIECLIKNAAEAVSEHGNFSLAVLQGETDFCGGEPGYFGPPLSAGSYLQIRVCDNGSGISYENLPRIFEPFFTTKFANRGLGLATVLGIIRRHRGAIMVKSEIDKGSEFSLLLPCQTSAGIVEQPAPNQIDPRAGTILVVDDDEIVAEILCAQLENLGYETVRAENGDAGLELFKQMNRNLSMIFLDLAMPGKSGIEMLRELRWLNPEIPVIICTGMNEISPDLSRHGIAAVLKKPFRIEDVDKAVLKAQMK